MDFQTWMQSVQSSLTASNHSTAVSAYSLSALAQLHQQGVSPVIVARQIIAGQIPSNPAPALPPPSPPSPYSPVSEVARGRLEFARAFCVISGWIIWAVGAGYVLVGLLVVVLGGVAKDRGAALAGLLLAAAPVVGGLLVMGAGAVLLVIGYGTRLVLDIHEKVIAP